MSGKVAFITGITGQDGFYLAELLLDKGYVVHGLRRHATTDNTGRLTALLSGKAHANGRFQLHYGDMTDAGNLTRLMKMIEPDEVYNLAAQSHVQVSFEAPEYTANVDALGTLRLLEAVRILGLDAKTRFFQASTSELFGNAPRAPQSETTPFAPRSPYAAAKLYAYWITVNYRQAYGVHASNGIVFNHESPVRGEEFVTRKITQGVAEIALGLRTCVSLGNLNAWRDWGHARDYVEGMWRMLQQDTPDDYVLATEQTHSVRRFAELAFACVGIDLRWTGQGVDEVGVNAQTGDILVRVDKALFRPAEVDRLVGDATKAKDCLGWEAVTPLEDLVQEMVEHDLQALKVAAL